MASSLSISNCLKGKSCLSLKRLINFQHSFFLIPAIVPGSIRTPSGRVEIHYDDQWGTICDDSWDIKEGNVVCRQLGSPKALRVFRGSNHSEGAGSLWLNGLTCSGNESHIYQCKHGGWGDNNCTHKNDASVKCRAVRLVNGGANFGRVEVLHRGMWGTICAHEWDINDGHVVCRQLGFPSAASVHRRAKFGQGKDPIWTDFFHCGGREASIFDCPHNGWSIENCSHKDDASVICNTAETKWKQTSNKSWSTFYNLFWLHFDFNLSARSDLFFCLFVCFVAPRPKREEKEADVRTQKY